MEKLKVITLREVRKIFKKEFNFRGTMKVDLKRKYEDIKKMKGKKQLYFELSEFGVAYFSVNNPYQVKVVCLLHKDSDN